MVFQATQAKMVLRASLATQAIVASLATQVKMALQALLATQAIVVFQAIAGTRAFQATLATQAHHLRLLQLQQLAQQQLTQH